MGRHAHTSCDGRGCYNIKLLTFPEEPRLKDRLLLQKLDPVVDLPYWGKARMSRKIWFLVTAILFIISTPASSFALSLEMDALNSSADMSVNRCVSVLYESVVDLPCAGSNEPSPVNIILSGCKIAPRSSFSSLEIDHSL